MPLSGGRGLQISETSLVYRARGDYLFVILLILFIFLVSDHSVCDLLEIILSLCRLNLNIPIERSFLNCLFFLHRRIESWEFKAFVVCNSRTVLALCLPWENLLSTKIIFYRVYSSPRSLLWEGLLHLNCVFLWSWEEDHAFVPFKNLSLVF